MLGRFGPGKPRVKEAIVLAARCLGGTFSGSLLPYRSIIARTLAPRASSAKGFVKVASDRSVLRIARQKENFQVVPGGGAIAWSP